MSKKTEVATKAEFDAATYATPKIKALVDGLAGITRRVVSSNVDAYAEIRKFESKILPIYRRYQEIIACGNKQHENRDQKLLGKAAARINQIPDKISQEEYLFRKKVELQKTKVEKLKKEGFNQTEIDQIIPSITEAEHQASEDKIKSLKLESERLFDFINNSPEFNIELLKGTSVYPNEKAEALA